MSDIYTTISIVAFILAGVFLVGAIVVFFVANVRGAYMELRGQNDKEWVKKRQNKAVESAAKKEAAKKDSPRKKLDEVSRIDGDGEAVTTLENGEEAGPGVYEPGTDVEEVDVKTEVGTVEVKVPFEAATTTEDTDDGDYTDGFRITKREISINTWELISY